jgi:hypothetical protein
MLDAAYPAHTAIKLILNIIPRTSPRRPEPGIAEQPANRFEFTFTPKHG